MEINHSYANNSEKGDTTAAYVVALEIKNCAGAILNIKNTHDTSTMYYKISKYLSAHADALETAVVTETGLAGTVASDLITSINHPTARITVSVKQNSAAGTYQIDWIAY